jgi:putative Mn2+ efflux pump MntP
MNLATIATLLVLAVGVSADAFAVALGRSLQIRGKLLQNALLIGVAFGVFQGLMPVIGYVASAVGSYVQSVDHWIAFGLLAAVGGKMIWEALHPDEDDAEVDADPDHPDHLIGLRELLVLAVATSIDALAVGVSLAFSSLSIAVAAPVIGLVTCVLSIAAVFIGQRIGTRFRTPAEVVGGIILVLIGLQILLEHLGVL